MEGTTTSATYATYAQATEDGVIVSEYEIWDTKYKLQVGGPYVSRTFANRKVDTWNLEYGGHRYVARPILVKDEGKEDTEMTRRMWNALRSYIRVENAR